MKMPERVRALELCKTPDEIDAVLIELGHSELSDKFEYLWKYMGVRGMFFDDGEDRQLELKYELLKDEFCAGDWRLMCGY